MLLSGIKQGKKKKKKQKTAKSTTIENETSDDGPPKPTTNAPQLKEPPQPQPQPQPPPPISENVSIAEQLRQSLASGKDIAKVLHDRSSSKPIDQLERRGRITTDKATTASRTTATATMNDPAATIIITTDNNYNINNHKREEDMTVAELAAKERRTGMNMNMNMNNNNNQIEMSWDEQMTRNLIRVGKKRQRDYLGKASNDSDEEVECMKKLLSLPLPGSEIMTTKNKKQQDQQMQKSRQRQHHRLQDEYQQQQKVTSKCAWWMESSSFSKHRLLALGNHLSLVMAPPSASLIAAENSGYGHHFYLVPLKHAASLVEAAEDVNVWEELQRFITSLSNMYARQGKGIIWMETVLPNTITKGGLWQTKLEVVPVPFNVLNDAPLYFQSTMVELTEEWGTHNKVLSTTLSKPLPRVIPKQGFPYFCVCWGSIITSSSSSSSSPNSNSTGYAMILESQDIRHDFGLDTLAGMMELDPMRFQRSRNKATISYEQERQGIAKFLEHWKSFDWTLELDK